MAVPNRPLPNPIPPLLAGQHQEPPTTGRRFVYAHPDGRYDVLCAALLDDVGVVWSFDVVTCSTDPRRLWVDVRVSSDAYSAFKDAAGFFSDLVKVRPKTLDGVTRLLDDNGFAAVDPGPWTEGQR